MDNKIKESAQDILSHMYESSKDGFPHTLSPDDAGDIIEYVQELESQYVYIDKFLEILTRMSARQSELLLELQEIVLRIGQEIGIDRK
jgi:hypothetical protein